jgi:hypothetical protein
MPNSASGSHVRACIREAQVPESARKDLIATIVEIVRSEELHPDVRDAALTLIGWLARRQGEECACTRGLYEARKQFMAVHRGQR